MACPFGYGHRGRDSDVDGDVDSDGDDVSPGSKRAHPPPPADGDRFDYNKDPVSWFFQNQIRSEEEFQARKTELRAAARARLDALFEKKGQRLRADSDGDFSIDSSELSAWDSDVASIHSLSSCVHEWREEAHFSAPAEATLQIALVALAAIAAHTCWCSLRAMMAVNRYWGIVRNGWAPGASFVTAAVLAAAAASCWLLLGRTGKRCLLGFQVTLHALYAATAALALVAYLMPSQIDADLKTSACGRTGAAGPLPVAASKLCGYLPAIESEVKAHVAAILLGCCLEAVATVATLAAASWYALELCFVEKRATKLKRRRRHRKHGIPWDKIKIENIGPVTTCGAGGGSGGGGRCPFSGAATAAAAPAAAQAPAAAEAAAAAKKDN
ncbi:hypothetical protein Rsub_10163 [Raphidocelis subcapitata]|uniref:Uncharacterized protein n=1 Tax=Raphidocelis subcapitata TaxID=307507 RepID=A0A2V0PF17_9CHLO|nr:hypothetical protein Rsub_10163 [Raphidocelis subcapitata]|eukprot:GBF97562.1 hypothetical protein Rsub_10163 [Raphidocelis subcapitata]